MRAGERRGGGTKEGARTMSKRGWKGGINVETDIQKRNEKKICLKSLFIFFFTICCGILKRVYVWDNGF